jgi:hypothetical protein
MQNIQIPNILFISCQSSNTLTSSNNCIAFPSAQGLKKRHRRERISEGLTNNIQLVTTSWVTAEDFSPDEFLMSS